MTLDIQTLLDGLEAPAIFYRENTVRYFNQPAQTLFPGLRQGKGLPEEFNAPDFPFRAEANQTPKGVLYLLRPKLEERSAGDLTEISRELRACLSVLAAAGESLLLKLEEDGETERLVAQATQSLYRLRRLADHSDLLRQLERRSVGVYREGTLDLAGLCSEVWEQSNALAEEAGVRFRLDRWEHSLLLRGDASLLRRMLLNLISNAIKAAGEGGEIGLRLERREERALLTVWDSGAGMEQERLAAIFRPQRRQGMPQPQDGPAMGLRIVRETVVLHGGLILAEARQEGGVRMTVSLPIRPGDKRGERLHAPTAWEEDPVQTVLVELSDALPARAYNRGDLEG